MGDGDEFDAIRGMLAVWGERARGIGDDAALLDLPAGSGSWPALTPPSRRCTSAASGSPPRRSGGVRPPPRSAIWRPWAPPPSACCWPSRCRTAGAARCRRSRAASGSWPIRSDCPVVGGNVSRGAELALTVTVLGYAARPLSRAGAMPGDIIFVTGRLGGPGAALADGRRGRRRTKGIARASRRRGRASMRHGGWRSVARGRPSTSRMVSLADTLISPAPAACNRDRAGGAPVHRWRVGGGGIGERRRVRAAAGLSAERIAKRGRVRADFCAAADGHWRGGGRERRGGHRWSARWVARARPFCIECHPAGATDVIPQERAERASVGIYCTVVIAGPAILMLRSRQSGL